jgi:hypothetical protein
MIISDDFLIVLGRLIVQASFDEYEETAENIQKIASTKEGVELLCRMIEGDLGGANGIIDDALGYAPS